MADHSGHVGHSYGAPTRLLEDGERNIIIDGDPLVCVTE
jgi:hypothetical protein